MAKGENGQRKCKKSTQTHTDTRQLRANKNTAAKGRGKHMRRRLSPKTEQGRRKNEREAQAETVTKQRHVLEVIARGSGDMEQAGGDCGWTHRR